jgi:2-(1,2-epoxy-1,2-dihydrophenyl)acetyl-CoA isomerase
VTLKVWNDRAVRAVVLTGNGNAFSAGGDLKRISESGEIGGMGPVFYDVAGLFHESITALRRMPKAVVAAINGPAAGGGFSLALACDYRVISQSAFMQLAYTSHGLSIDGGGTFTLPRLVGLSNAMRIALFDDRMLAQDCVDLGLAHEMSAAEELDDRALTLARRFASMPVEVIGRTKRLFNRSFDTSLERQLEAERTALARAGNHAEGVEGVTAFLEKREPDYR